MFQKRDAAVPQFWIWKKNRITETASSSKFSDTDFSKKSFEKSAFLKSSESDIFLTFDVFEENFVWRDKTYAPWNCWVITFTLTPCDDFIKRPWTTPIIWVLFLIENRDQQTTKQARSKLGQSDHSLADSCERGFPRKPNFRIRENFVAHQPWKPEPSSIIFY